LAQFRELQAFAQFSSDLDPETKKQIERGRRITEVLKQLPYSPVAVEEQVAILWAVTRGFLDEVEVEKIKDFEQKFIAYFKLRGKNKDLEKVTKEFVRTYGKH
jgi:F-type H+-transporting ATPase subunit alpha